VSNKLTSLFAFVIAAFGGSGRNTFRRLKMHHAEVPAQASREKELTLILSCSSS